MRRLASVIPAIVILLAPLAMFWTLWVNPLSAGEDDVGYYFPLRVLTGRALAEGRWPEENPSEATGSPILGDPQSAVFHPTTWLFAAAGWQEQKTSPAGGDYSPFMLAYTLSLFSAYWLAGGGAYLYLRRLGLARVAGLFGAVAFMFSGFFVGHRVHLSVIHAAATLPWGLWCIERLRAWRDAGAVLPWLAAAIYLAIAAGHWPTLIHVGLLWGAYFLFRARPLWRCAGVWLAAAFLAALATGPQLLAAADLIGQATRQKIGYATAGENSFFPLAAVLAAFPYLLGNRNPNFFAQPWWGSWHQCEMLGYVGLSTLVLAGSATWRLFRGPRAKDLISDKTAGPDAPLRPLVRTWTCLAIGAGLWMLGYYTPLYRLVHMTPVLGIVRCPARMVLGVEMALAALAAIAIHALAGGHAANTREVGDRGGKPSPSAQSQENTALPALAASVRRAACWTLPLVMAGVLVLLASAALILPALGLWGQHSPFLVGGPRDALDAVLPTNPAVWVAAATWLATACAILWWSRSPARRSAALVAVLLADLFFITRYVDVPAVQKPDFSPPPAAKWLGENAATGRDSAGARTASPVRVWGLGKTYFHRQRELLLPKTCGLYGAASIASYGPFQSPAHAHLLGFNICGYNRDWADLLRRNRILSMYNVRYILAEANSEHEAVLQSVRAGEEAREEGPNLLSTPWTWRRRVSEANGIAVLKTPFLWDPAECHRSVAMEPNAFYRISLEARGGEGGAANFLRADVFHKGDGGPWWQEDAWGLTVPAEQIVSGWRLFRWTFRAEANFPQPLGFRLHSMSERPIEVRGLALRKVSGWDGPEDADSLPAGENIYRKVATLPAEPSPKSGQRLPAVVIYENLLARPDVPAAGKGLAWTEARVEAVRWNRMGAGDPATGFAPDVGLRSPQVNWTRLTRLTTLPAIGLYLACVLVALWRGPRRAA
jgi:hypothetical protein